MSLLIHMLFSEAEKIDMPLWLSGGWAVDAKIGRITREHEDIDVVYPAERVDDFLCLLQNLGGKVIEQTSYGFLADLKGVVIDCEPCMLVEGRYAIEGPPAGTCPAEKTGSLDGVPVRCASWEALLWDYFHYLEESPQADWRSKDVSGFDLVKSLYGEAETQALHRQFKAWYAAEYSVDR